MSGDPDDKRRDAPRFPAQIQVRVACKEWAQVERLVTGNASRGGLFIRAPRSPAVGSALRIEVELPDHAKLSLAGRVVHVLTPEVAAERGSVAGFGVKFDAAHESDLILLEAMARAEVARPAAGEADAAAAAEEAAELPPAPAPARAAGAADTVRITADRPPVAIARLQPVRPEDREPADAPCTSSVVLGIDYGTTYSSVALVRNGEAIVLPDGAGRRLVPSVVSYPAGGGVLCGWDARERVATDPGHTVHSAKRLLGRRASEPEVANQLAQQAWRSLTGPSDQVIIEIGGMPLSVPQIAAEVMRLLRRTAEGALNEAVEEVVLTVPVTWGPPQRTALRKAVELAGMRVVGLMDEPASAGLAYGYGQTRNEIVAVYDFSGGTFDFTLIDISAELFRIIASAGDPWLGGDDFDYVLAKEAANAFWKEHKIELQKRLVEWQRLVFACEAAKRALTDAERAVIDVPAIARTAAGPLHLHMEITRGQFEALCGELVQRSLEIVGESIAAAGLDAAHIGQVVLTGGCTRIPVVRAAVERFFERRIEAVVNPDEAVALGAAIQAALLANDSARAVKRAR